jgi:trigger factor
MIPGFEDGLLGLSAGEEKVLSLVFPDDYQVADLKGAAVEFKVTVNSVSSQVLPEVNEEFFAGFGVEGADIGKFRSDVKENMEREKERVIKNRLKAEVLDALLERNPIDVPNALVASEIDALRQQAVQQYGGLSDKFDVKSLLPDHLFQARAHKRTALGLLVSDVVLKNKVKVDASRLRALVDSIAATYEDSESVVNYYYGNKELLAGVEAAVLEEQVVDLLLEKAVREDKAISYQELIKPIKESEQD